MSINTEDLWAAINEYVYACEGNPEQNVYGNLSRQEAVVKVEKLVQTIVDDTRDDVLGNTLLPEEIEHVGVNSNRLAVERHVFEKIFAEEWADRNDSCLNCPDPNGTLDYILSEDHDHIPQTKSQRDAAVAASVVQWLGTEVGFDFLMEVMYRALLIDGTHNQVVNGLGSLTKRLLETNQRRGKKLVDTIAQEMRFFL